MGGKGGRGKYGGEREGSRGERGREVGGREGGKYGREGGYYRCIYYETHINDYNTCISPSRSHDSHMTIPHPPPHTADRSLSSASAWE